MKLPDSTLQYILSFLLYEKPELIQKVGYTSDVSAFENYDVVIVPSSFFNKKNYETRKNFPNKIVEIEGIAALYGAPKIEKINHTVVCYADIIASTFFLISRYEDFLLSKNLCDEHLRFSAKNSTLQKFNLLQRPLVDEYSTFLLRLLNAEYDLKKQFKVSLTHDVDILTKYRYLRGFLGGIKNGLTVNGSHLKNAFSALRKLENDEAYTFPWLAEQDCKLPQAEKIFFVKAAQKNQGYDRPQYSLKSRDALRFRDFCLENKYKIGLHVSYAAGANSSLIEEEKIALETAWNIKIDRSRHHFLRSCAVTDFEALLNNGIMHDYTMAYADCAGFRLGTTRNVRWINPMTLQLTELVLHPLSLMECTLCEKKYMNLTYADAIAYAENMISQTINYGGSLTLLWHNTSVTPNSVYRPMYQCLIQKLEKK